MCEYSSTDGFANDWHFVHLGSRAIGGAALVITEANAVSPEGRITPQDLGIYSDRHIPGLKRITDFLHQHGSYAGTQLAHAGRKASMAVPWEKVRLIPESEGGWQPVAPSAVPFDEPYGVPSELNRNGMDKIVSDFVVASQRALEAGFDLIEIHAAHGYLLHEFLSPLSNRRSDEYGGSFENRIRFPLEVVRAVRASWPEHLPMFVRISATDWAPQSLGPAWDLSQSVEFARHLKREGVDLIDVSTGGNHPAQQIPCRSRLPGSLRRNNSTRSGHSDRSSRNDHGTCSGRPDHSRGPRGSRFARTRISAQPVLASAGCRSPGTQDHLAGSICPRGKGASRTAAACFHLAHFLP